MIQAAAIVRARRMLFTFELLAREHRSQVLLQPDMGGFSVAWAMVWFGHAKVKYY